ncbi:uncharacterized protein LOC135367299 [Ornithodoros turicata]|uniref:uncharacterized protein LOC135367299 n=1 Tax=Ornithodoros turicata TaxID=34597 RepID=UPI0031390612
MYILTVLLISLSIHAGYGALLSKEPQCRTIRKDPKIHTDPKACQYYCNPDDAHQNWQFGYFKNGTECQTAQDSAGETSGRCYDGYCFNYRGGLQLPPTKKPKPTKQPKKPKTN